MFVTEGLYRSMLEKGYNKPTLYITHSVLGIMPCIPNTPTNADLFDWVFKWNNSSNKLYFIEWIEYWHTLINKLYCTNCANCLCDRSSLCYNYNPLEYSPLLNGFTSSLIRWFENNNYFMVILPEIKGWRAEIHIKNDKIDIIKIEDVFLSKDIAINEAINKCFELMKSK